MEMFRWIGVEKEIMDIGAQRKQEGGILSASTLAEGLEGFDSETGRKMMATLLGKFDAYTPCKGKNT